MYVPPHCDTPSVLVLVSKHVIVLNVCAIHVCVIKVIGTWVWKTEGYMIVFAILGFMHAS